MKGNICIVSETGWAVSNDAVLDAHRERIETPEGPKMMPYSMFEAANPFSSIRHGERVKVAFQAEDGKNVSYAGVVDRITDSKVSIRVLEQINEYKQIVQEVLSWHKA